jgi:predicted RNA polymerase sigma factor
MLLFCGTREGQRAFEAMTPEELGPRMAEVGRWFGEHRSRITEGWESTDWPQILLLYDELIRRASTPVARLNRAVAVRYTAGPRAALADVESLLEPLSGYHLLHATHAAILRDRGRDDEARRADQRALMLTDNPAERALLEQRIS